MRTIVHTSDDNTTEPDTYEDAEGGVYAGDLTVMDLEQSVLRIYYCGDWTRMEVQT